MTGYELALSTLGGEPSVSIRLNPFKKTDSFPEGFSVPWCEFGRLLRSRPSFTLDPLFHAGAYYVQDSSAMFVGYLFRKFLPAVTAKTVRVLDLCAAPGGKTTDLATSLRLARGDDFVLVSNEVMKQRARVLSDNVAVWGDPNVIVTSVDSSAFASFGSWFDVIVADVPCSGEGMFRKDARAREEWSEDVVELCRVRQRKIVAQAWPSLREGGLLIYSTCTFEDGENDGNVEWIADTLGAEMFTAGGPAPFDGVRKTRTGYLLVPGEVPGEGQFVAILRKTSQAPPTSRFCRMESLKPLRCGVNRGVLKGKDFVPDPDYPLSLAFASEEYVSAEVSRATALSYLHRDAITLPPGTSKGYIVIRYEGLPLGFVKNLGGRCNNLLPPGRRILMDVK